MILIGTLPIPDISGFKTNTAYRRIGPKTLFRSLNGTAIIATRWQKLGFTLSGSGWIPEGMDSLDEDVAVDFHLTGWRSTSSASPIITIPRTFRVDEFTPVGYAFVVGEAVDTDVTLSGNEATLTTVVGASQYQVKYCPIINSVITKIDRQHNQESNTFSWSIEAEES